jgi:ribose transport system permease protein
VTQEREATAGTVADSEQVQEPLTGSGQERSGAMGVLLGSSVGRNLGLIVALIVLCIVGIATAGEQFASTDNALTILRLAAVIGVVSICQSARSWHCLRSGQPPWPPSRWRVATTGP